MNGIHYHFFKSEDDTLFSRIKNTLGFIKSQKYQKNRLQIKQTIDQIQPDIINLIGLENTYYSIAALDINNYPVYVSIQTVLNNPKLSKYGVGDSYAREIEMKILQKEKYFGCSGRLYHDLIQQVNDQAIFFKMFFPIQHPPKIEGNIRKEFDFVFYAARVVKNKGIEDTLDALALVKKQKPSVKLNVIGYCPKEYKQFLLKRIEALNLKDNVIFHDYFPVHEDLFRQVLKSKVAVVPGITAIINGTVIEPTLLGLPVVTYKTSGTPYLNREKECVLLAEIGDIEGLANNMLKLMNDENYGQMLAQNANEFVTRTFDNTTSAKRLVEDYKAVIAHYHNGTPIPEELLFDLNEFPKY
jgi:glycosyltransferase involved in cell wall biosynthesis